MNIIRFEVKKSIKFSIGWLIAIILVFVYFFIVAYPIFKDESQELIKLLSEFPQEYLIMFGFSMNMFSGYLSFYAFSYLYIGLLFGIMALILSINIYAREKHSKCMDFIFTKPINRETLFAYKYIACIMVLLVVNLVYALIVVLDMNKNIENFSFSIKILQIILSPFLTQLLFVSVGMFIGVFFRKIRSASGVGTITGIGIFLLTSIANIINKDWLDAIAPLEYFNPCEVIENGYYRMDLVRVAIIVFLLLNTLSYIKYCKRDVRG